MASALIDALILVPCTTGMAIVANNPPRFWGAKQATASARHWPMPLRLDLSRRAFQRRKKLSLTLQAIERQRDIPFSPIGDGRTLDKLRQLAERGLGSPCVVALLSCL